MLHVLFLLHDVVWHAMRRYARHAELTNARAAMVGFLAAVLMEALTGRGILGQLVLYLKLVGVLTFESGF